MVLLVLRACALLLLVTPAVAQLGGQLAELPPSGIQVPPRGNVLLVLVDDMGVDMLQSYGVGTDLPALPTIGKLAAEGIQFANVWANPVCSPTRATILTGRYGFRTGVGHTVKPGNHGLPLEEVTLPELLRKHTSGTYRSGAFGKWHLAGHKEGGNLGPNLAGFDHYAGVIQNVLSYFLYEKVVNGSAGWKSGYVTSETIRDTLTWTMQDDDPWFAYVALHAGHFPYHEPPAPLSQTDLTGAGPPAIDPRPYYKAMLEALDFELKRLLDGLGSELDNTTVILLGDNGTPMECIAPPFDPAKGKSSLFEGGIHVPMIVAGAAVDAADWGSECQALVNTTDLFATVLQLCGVDTDAIASHTIGSDSVSALPYIDDPSAVSQRDTLFAEIFTPNGTTGPYKLLGRTVRDQRFKYIATSLIGDPLYGEGFYDLAADPFETVNLLQQRLRPDEQAALTRLRRQLDLLVDDRL